MAGPDVVVNTCRPEVRSIRREPGDREHVAVQRCPTSTPICCAASRSCAVHATAQPQLLNRRSRTVLAALPFRCPITSRGHPPPPPPHRADVASPSDLSPPVRTWLGNARGCPKYQFAPTGRGPLMPRWRGRGASGRAHASDAADSSIRMPSNPQPHHDHNRPIGSGVFR